MLHISNKMSFLAQLLHAVASKVGVYISSVRETCLASSATVPERQWYSQSGIFGGEGVTKIRRGKWVWS